MVYQASQKQDKFSCRIKGQSRPFIDENLQIRFPGVEPLIDQSQHLYTSRSIHAYYSHSGKTFYGDALEIELEHTRLETQHAYEPWKEIQQKLNDSFPYMK